MIYFKSIKYVLSSLPTIFSTIVSLILIKKVIYCFYIICFSHIKELVKIKGQYNSHKKKLSSALNCLYFFLLLLCSLYHALIKDHIYRLSQKKRLCHTFQYRFWIQNYNLHIFTSFQKEISIRETACSKKHLALKSCLKIFFVFWYS